MLIGTYRPVDLTLAAHPLKPLKQDLLIHHLCYEIALPPLEEAEVAEYLADELGGAAVPDGLAGLIYGRSEGNPLFMVSILQHLREQRLLACVVVICECPSTFGEPRPAGERCNFECFRVRR